MIYEGEAKKELPPPPLKPPLQETLYVFIYQIHNLKQFLSLFLQKSIFKQEKQSYCNSKEFSFTKNIMQLR